MTTPVTAAEKKMEIKDKCNFIYLGKNLMVRKCTCPHNADVKIHVNVKGGILCRTIGGYAGQS